jgi:hypothetical protein
VKSALNQRDADKPSTWICKRRAVIPRSMFPTPEVGFATKDERFNGFNASICTAMSMFAMRMRRVVFLTPDSMFTNLCRYVGVR